MADKKFSELDPVGSLTGTEILPVIKEGLPKRTTVADVVANYVLKTGDTMTGGLTTTTLTAGTATDVLGIALSVIRNNVAVGRIDNNASGLRVQAQNGSLQLRGTGNTGISIDASGNAVVAGTITGANLSGTNTGDQPLGSRTITGTTNQVTVTNGDGVSGNPTLSLPSAITTPGSLTITGNNSPQANSTYTLGTPSLYWANTYTKRVYFNSTNYVTGEYAGVTQFVASGTGNVAEFKNTVNDTKFTLNAIPGKGSFSILSAASDYRAFVADGNGTLYWRIGNYGNNNLSFRTNSDGFTGYTDALALTIDGTQKAKFFGDIESADKNIILGTTTGTKIGTSTTQKLGFFNATPVVQPSATPANATDLATALTLINDLKAKLISLGLVA